MGVDLIGSGDKIVAIVDLEGSEKKIVEVVKEITAHNKNVKTVIQEFPGERDSRRVKGTLKVVWGDEDTEVLHKEHGYMLKLDPQKVYFSPRESAVRQYISSKVKPGESVLLMFAGVGPFAISIAKSQPGVKEIVAVEIDPVAVKYMEENVRMNKVSHLVTPIHNSVNEACRNYKNYFNRVIMPMLYANNYIDVAVRCAKSGGTIHTYLVSAKENHDDSKNFIATQLKKLNKNYEIENIRRINMYAPGKWKILMDMKLK